MNRRDLIAALALALVGTGAAHAHTPFGQWVVYRKKHLLIGAHRTDPGTYETAKELVAALARHLPNAKSRVARAPNPQRLASLIGTEQLEVAVLGTGDAVAMREGSGQFKPYGPIALTRLATLDEHILVAHRRFPERHAWLVSATLQESGLGTVEPRSEFELALHPGSLSFANGNPEPSAPAN